MIDLNIIQIILILLVALFAGFESVLDVFQLHQPIIVGALIGAITGNLAEGLILVIFPLSVKYTLPSFPVTPAVIVLPDLFFDSIKMPCTG